MRFSYSPPAVRPSTGRIARRSIYTCGHFAKSLTWSFPDLLLAYYANVRLGMSAQETGMLLCVSMGLGALLDVSGAFLLRRFEGSARRILLVQLLGGVATAFTLVLVFSPMQGTFFFMVAALTLFRIAYAVYDISQNALLSLLPEDADDAHHYVVWRQVLSGLARLCVAGLAFLLVGRGVSIGQEYLAAAVIAGLILLTAWAALLWLNPSQVAPNMAYGPSLAIPVGLPTLCLAGAALGGPAALAARMVTFVETPSPDDHRGAVLLSAFVIGTVIGPFVLPPPSSARRPPGRLLGAITIVATAVFLSDPTSRLAAPIACAAYGFGMGGMMTLFWRRASLAIRSHALHTGIRTDLAAFALLTAAIKSSVAVFGMVLGWMLDGFKAGDPATMLWLGSVTAAGALVFLAASSPGKPIGSGAT